MQCWLCSFQILLQKNIFKLHTVSSLNKQETPEMESIGLTEHAEMYYEN
jgi:hypothetical protein